MIGRALDAATTRTPARVAVLASGSGSNLQAILDHLRAPAHAAHAAHAATAPAGDARRVAEVVWVGTNRADAGALVRAHAAGIAAEVVADHAAGDALLARLAEVRADMLVLAGYLRQVPANVVSAFHGRMLNVHPALLPSFGGTGMYGERVHAAVIAAGVTLTGVTVHFVSEEYDRGSIVAQWPVAVRRDDTPATLAARVLRVEHRLYPACVAAVASGQVVLGADGIVRGEVPSLHPEFDRLLP